MAGRAASVTTQPAVMPAARSFAEAMRGEFIAVIAEIKRSSPSRGSINPSLDAAEQAARFAEGGAAAISVLTEPTRFAGSIEDIAGARAACDLPILKKDFHLTETHIREAAELGVSAALLIVRAVPPATLRRCIRVAEESGIDLLVEVHRKSELDLALDSGARIIGVNARDLETLEMNPAVHGELLPLIPAYAIAIAESGMASVSDVEQAAAAGADAVLIGSSLSRCADPAVLLRSLTRVKRRMHVRPD